MAKCQYTGMCKLLVVGCHTLKKKNLVSSSIVCFM